MKDVHFDYKALRTKIHERFKTEQEFAKAIGIGRVSLSARLNNKIDFSCGEIMRACEALEIGEVEITGLFFVRLVRKREP